MGDCVRFIKGLNEEEENVMKNEWNVVHEMDDEKGNPTCWAMQINNGFGKFVWITLNHKNYYDVEVDRNGEFKTLVTCKSMRSAKRWVTMYIINKENNDKRRN